jgi:hypothetical protein
VFWENINYKSGTGYYFYAGARWGYVEMTSGGEPRKINSILRTLLKAELFVLTDLIIYVVSLYKHFIIKINADIS